MAQGEMRPPARIRDRRLYRPEGSRVGFGALLLGVYDPDWRLASCGKVGTGFNDRSLATLLKRLQPLQQDAPAFHNPPRGAEARRSHWVKPVLVAEVGFYGMNERGHAAAPVVPRAARGQVGKRSDP